MSLTQRDLQQIGELLDEKLEIKLEEKLESKLEEKLDRMLDEKLEKKLEEKLEQKFTEKLEPVYKILNKHEKHLKALKNNQELMIDIFDKQQINHDKRIDRIEAHLDLVPLVS